MFILNTTLPQIMRGVELSVSSCLSHQHAGHHVKAKHCMWTARKSAVPDMLSGRCAFSLLTEALPDQCLPVLPYRYAMKTLEKSEMLERNKVGRVLTEEGILNQGQQCFYH